MLPSRWRPTSNDLLPTTIGKSDHMPSRLRLVLRMSLRIRLNKEPRSSKQIRKNLILYLKLEIQGLTICKC